MDYILGKCEMLILILVSKTPLNLENGFVERGKL